jgi:hypothetical protein
MLTSVAITPGIKKQHESGGGQAKAYAMHDLLQRGASCFL